mmetsp:Transcript_14690/g.34360  ORF Transcript_14690/g.34360 Transcript_14690/m.34360 type:complete len:247 (+) Transcript_14690:180-920(+)
MRRSNCWTRMNAPQMTCSCPSARMAAASSGLLITMKPNPDGRKRDAIWLPACVSGAEDFTRECATKTRSTSPYQEKCCRKISGDAKPSRLILRTMRMRPESILIRDLKCMRSVSPMCGTGTPQSGSPLQPSTGSMGATHHRCGRAGGLVRRADGHMVGWQPVGAGWKAVLPSTEGIVAEKPGCSAGPMPALSPGAAVPVAVPAVAPPELPGAPAVVFPMYLARRCMLTSCCCSKCCVSHFVSSTWC